MALGWGYILQGNKSNNLFSEIKAVVHEKLMRTENDRQLYKEPIFSYYLAQWTPRFEYTYLTT